MFVFRRVSLILLLRFVGFVGTRSGFLCKLMVLAERVLQKKERESKSERNRELQDASIKSFQFESFNFFAYALVAHGDSVSVYQ